MKYGFFDDKNKEYVITRPDTPMPWINYLGSEKFFGIISNTAGGYCFYQDSRLRRLTRYRYNSIPLDSNGRYIYIADGDSVWNPMWKPMRVALDKYECRHGMGYTKIISEKNDLVVEITFFVPPGFNTEVWNVTVINKSQKVKNVKLWSFVEWCLWDAYDDMTNFQRNYSIGEVEVEKSTIFHKTEYRERRNHYAFFSCNQEISGFDTDRNQFIGVHEDLSNPLVIQNKNSKNSFAHGWQPIASHQLDLNLSAGEAKKLSFLLGYEENENENKHIAPGVINKEKFYSTQKQLKNEESISNSFNDLTSFWQGMQNKFQVNTEDDLVNRMANIWNPYQCMVTFNLSRSTSFYESGIGRGMGYRDSNQDILGFVHMIPDRARQRILDISATQLSDGTCFHQYQPLTKKGNADVGGGFNDDPLWLILSTSAYIRETGDTSILQEKVGFADIEKKDATLIDHLDISVKYTLDNRGPNNLPLIGHADWNDCLNLNCFSTTPGESFQLAEHESDGKTAESVMIAGLFCAACEDLSALYNNLGEKRKSKKMSGHAEDMRQVIMESGWDGDWFLRAYDANGNKIGSKECTEGKIFIESQGWCIMGGIGTENGVARKSLKSVKKHLSTDNGIMLQQPAYSEYHLELGEISSYPPGYKENAGIFTHNNTWIQIAETILGNGDQAMDYYKSVCPSSKESQIDIYKSEPYVYSQMSAGCDAAIPGEAKNSWLTGTAAWSFVVLSQYILGIRPDFDGLVIDPCIPKAWNEFTVEKQYRNALYKIHITNPDNISKGVSSICVDGKRIEGNMLPDFQDNKTHIIEVIMGK
ncbi:MAG: glycosyl transferase [Calditrichaeota bacterium]|nr:MAG: glycosyl transferase [Calditrichota bacterium]MBL1204759.1 glycosyl transferase [Calditrichota bacterium]NOG44587.1 glycosyl transferase [Calditrichota bacterium]